MKLRILLTLAAAALLFWSVSRLAGGDAPPAPALAGDVADEPTSSPPPSEEGVDPREALGDPPARTWTLAGRVAVPAGTPEDEQLILRTRAGEHRAESPVDDDGRFELELPVDAAEARVELAGRYLFLDEPARVAQPADMTAELLLEPRLGALLRVRLRPPDTHEPHALDAAELTVRSADELGSPGRTSGHLGGGVVELGGLDPDHLYTASIECPPFVRESRDALRLYAGKRTDVEVALRAGVRVAGHVLDSEGQTVEGVEVSVERPNPIPTGLRAWITDGEQQTDADGGFSFAGLHAGPLRVRARGDGELRASVELDELADGASVDDVVLRFEAGEHVAGRVRWPEDAPAEGASVRVLPMRNPWSRGVETETDADGRFRCDGLPGGPYAVLAAAERAGSEASTATWRARADGVAAGRTDVELVLALGGRVAGRVVDDLGAPVERSELVARPLDDALGVRSKEERKERFRGDGGFMLEGLDDGLWDVRAEAKGHAPSPWRRVRMPDGAPELTLVVPRRAQVAGFVRSPDGGAIAGASVRLQEPTDATLPTSRKTDTDAAGAFTFDDVVPGAVALVASADGLRASEPFEVELAPGERRESLELELRLGARLEGEVDPSVEDYASRKVLVMPADSFATSSTLCDEDGRFLFEGLAPGRWTVMFDWQPSGGGGADWIEGFQHRAEETVELADGETTHVVLGRPQPDAVHVSGLVLQGGEPQPGYLVYAHPPENDTAKPAAMPLNIARADEDGGYAMTLPGPGRYRFSVGPDTRFQVRYFRELPDEPDVALDFELPGCALSGTVVRGDGSPAARHPLLLVCADAHADSRAFGDVHSGSTDGDGRFRYEGLQPGEYVLRLGGWSLDTHGLGVELIEGIVLREGEEPDEPRIELHEAAVIEGGVLGPDGRPAPGVEVNVHDSAGRELYIWRAVETDYTGSFRFPNVGAGVRTVVAADGEGRRAEAEVPLAPGEVARVTLQLE